MRGIGAILEQKVIPQQLVPDIPTNINLLELVGPVLPEIPTSIGAEYIEFAEIPTGIQLEEIVMPDYLLDQYPNAAAAYSLRKLKSDALYSVQVERYSDNLAINVILDASGSLTLNSLVSSGGTLGAWVGANSAGIKGWYDQSGNNNNTWQTTTSKQLLLINSGVLNTLNGITSLYLDGNDDWLQSEVFASFPQPLTKIAVSSYDIISNYKYLIDGSSTNRGILGTEGDGNWRIYSGSADDYATEPTIGVQYLQYALFSGSSSQLYINGTGLGVKSIGTMPLDRITIGATAATTGQYINGNVQEVIIYPSDESLNRAGIEANINNHYSIYLTSLQVDQFLIDADNGGAYTNGMVIDLSMHQPRTSASDGAVSNLTTLGVTVITS